LSLLDFILRQSFLYSDQYFFIYYFFILLTFKHHISNASCFLLSYVAMVQLSNAIPHINFKELLLYIYSYTTSNMWFVSWLGKGLLLLLRQIKPTYSIFFFFIAISRILIILSIGKYICTTLFISDTRSNWTMLTFINK